MILALASARKVRDLLLLRIDNDHLQRPPTVWKLRAGFGAKQERPHHSILPISYTECPHLCPVRHLNQYIRRISKQRVGIGHID